jgi:hypothetical protein
MVRWCRHYHKLKEDFRLIFYQITGEHKQRKLKKPHAIAVKYGVRKYQATQHTNEIQPEHASCLHPRKVSLHGPAVISDAVSFFFVVARFGVAIQFIQTECIDQHIALISRLCAPLPLLSPKPPTLLLCTSKCKGLLRV